MINTKAIEAALSTNPCYSSDYPEYIRNQLQDKANSEWEFSGSVYTIKKVQDDKTQKDIVVRLTSPYKLSAESNVIVWLAQLKPG
jgi:hypothetical protein